MDWVLYPSDYDRVGRFWYYQPWPMPDMWPDPYYFRGPNSLYGPQSARVAHDWRLWLAINCRNRLVGVITVG